MSSALPRPLGRTRTALTCGAHLLGRQERDFWVPQTPVYRHGVYMTRVEAGRIVDAATRLGVLADQLSEAHSTPGTPAGELARLRAGFEQAMAKLVSLGARGG